MPEAAPLSNWLWRQQWLPRAIRKQAYKKLNHQGIAPDNPFSMDFYGLRYEGNLSNNIEFAMYFYGAFEKPLLHFMRDAIRGLNPHEACCCDIGANIGQHTLFLSRFAARVHAFEPYAEVSRRLSHHLHLNAISNVELHAVGLGDSNTTLPFYAPTGSNQGIGSFVDASTDKGNTCIGELTVARGDDYFPAHGITRVDLMKIDVEGLEQQVLRGLHNTLRSLRPLIVCEVTYGEAGSFASREALLEALPEDYDLYVFNTRKPDGRTARRRGARAKRSGAYELVPLETWRDRDQDDVVAVPREKLSALPLRGRQGW